ncbi:hypothetical protein TRICI_005254 [Trichomonascus ciferrii]|uniref:DUF676 domain-containing protein n=1 Tax=Trichomonascus ciferrii TaxID=44093 RepID=A0A642UUI7_9ASCO|nr:hypothetical protein TRICI_005254 [Trichomonascus ciferrii]
MNEFLVKRYKEDEVRFEKISIVGYSLGGLIARYVVGVLLENGFFNNVKPITFATFATPHLGSKFHGDSLNVRVLNFLGSNFLGVSGNDMFGFSSTVLDELTDAEGPFIRGLKKFKHLQLFANAIHDRTVPFFTAFITDVDPFQKRDFVDFVYYETPQKYLTNSPEVDDRIFVDMYNSRYRETSSGIDTYPSVQERKFQAFALVTLPWVFPLIFALTSLTTVMSRYRVREAEKAMEANESTLIKRKSRSEGIADLAYYTIDEVLLEGAMDTFESPDGGSASPRTTPRPRVTNHARRRFSLLPIRGSKYNGYEGLIASTPDSMNLDDKTKGWIHTLNQLPWEKYVVKLRRMHSHAEIVNRRNAPGQGQVVLDFWVELMSHCIAD